MDSYKIFSRRTMGLDNRVWRVMLILSFLSVSLLSYTIIDRNKCVSFTFEIGGRTHLNDSFYYTGENISFRASISSERITWDFNDNSASTTEGVFVTHKFLTEGKYYVSASTNPGCETGKLITVKNKPLPSFRDAPSYSKEIVGISSTIVGKEEEFISPALADSFYEWVILYHPEIGTKYGEKAKFQFANGGRYIMQLTLDHDRIKSYTKQIDVEDLSKPKIKMPEDIQVPLIPKNLPPIIPRKEDPAAPPAAANTGATVPPPPAAPTKTIRVADETFKSMLQSLVETDMMETDFYKYLCGTGSTPVVVNGDRKKTMTFTILCLGLSGKKTKKNFLSSSKFITIESVKLSRDENNCITKIEVNY